MISERDSKIIDLYLYHPELSTEEIAKQFKISKATISRIARLNNLPRRKGNSGKRLTLQQEEEIIQKYLDKVPKQRLSKEYGISTEKINSLLKKYSCENNSYSLLRNPNLKEDYFHKIDEENKAYWLGWLISDGSITNNPEKTKYQLDLTIKKEDEKILHLLEKDLGVKNKVYISNKKYKRFSLGCKKIIYDLDQLGITQNKTFSVKVPNFDKKFNAAFLRGLFDGDGGFSEYTRKTGQKCQELSFCGNEYVITWVRDCLFSEIPHLAKNSITNEGSIKRIRWSSKKDIKLIFSYLYKNKGDHFLDRKYNLIQANIEVTS